jgi:hypothetical protein
MTILYFVSGEPTNKTECHCPAACNVTVYTPDLSYAALSVDGIDALLADDRAQIAGKHVTAKELQQRVKAASMIDMLQKLRRVQQSVADFRHFWTTGIESGREGSFDFRVIRDLERIQQMAVNDLSNLFWDLPNFQNSYEWHVGGERGGLDKYISEIFAAINEAYSLQFLHDNATEIFNTAFERLQRVAAAVRNMGTLANYEHTMSGDLRDWARDLPKRAVRRQNTYDYCSSWHLFSKRTLDVISEKFARGVNPVGEYNWRIVQLSNCLNEYPNYLSDTQQWLAEHATETSIE